MRRPVKQGLLGASLLSVALYLAHYAQGIPPAERVLTDYYVIVISLSSIVGALLCFVDAIFDTLDKDDA